MPDIVCEMKEKTTTIRIKKKLHLRIKKHLKPYGTRIENWTERKLIAALSETEMPN